MPKTLSQKELKEQLALLELLQKNFPYFLASVRSTQSVRSIADARIMISPQQLKIATDLLTKIRTQDLQFTISAENTISYSQKSKKKRILTADEFEDQANTLIALTKHLKKYVESLSVPKQKPGTELCENLLFLLTILDTASIQLTLQQELN